MDDVELSRLLGRVTSALDSAKDTENELFRMQMTLISVLKKYGDRKTSIVVEPDDTPAVCGDIAEVNDSGLEEDESSPSSGNHSDLLGHQDKTARLIDSDDEVEEDGPWKPSSLEIYKKRTEQSRRKQEEYLLKHRGLNRFAAFNRSGGNTTTEIHTEVSDESSDDSYRTPSSSQCDLLSSESNPSPISESNPSPVAEEGVVEGVVVRVRSDTPETPVNSPAAVEMSEVIAQVSEMMISAIEMEQKQVPPLNLPRVSTPVRPNSPSSSRDRILSEDSEPFTLIPAPNPTPLRLIPGSYNRAVSSPENTRTTPVDTPQRGFRTLPAHSNLNPDCPICGLVFTQDHDFNYRNFHTNSCLDSLG